MLYIIDNGGDHSDHEILFINSDLPEFVEAAQACHYQLLLSTKDYIKPENGFEEDKDWTFFSIGRFFTQVYPKIMVGDWSTQESKYSYQRKDMLEIHPEKSWQNFEPNHDLWKTLSLDSLHYLFNCWMESFYHFNQGYYPGMNMLQMYAWFRREYKARFNSDIKLDHEIKIHYHGETWVSDGCGEHGIPYQYQGHTDKLIMGRNLPPYTFWTNLKEYVNCEACKACKNKIGI